MGATSIFSLPLPPELHALLSVVMDIDELRPIFTQADFKVYSIRVDDVQEVDAFPILQGHVRLFLLVSQHASCFNFVASLGIFIG